MKNPQKVSCPICNKKSIYDIKNLYRPFCSTRCKLIDLGEWANESRRIPGEAIDFKLNNDSDEQNQ